MVGDSLTTSGFRLPSPRPRLIEMGKLDLDAPLRTYLPDLRLSGEGVAERVTLRHALTHTGGWVGDFFEDCVRATMRWQEWWARWQVCRSSRRWATSSRITTSRSASPGARSKW